MRKMPIPEKGVSGQPETDDLAVEYRFDYAKAQPNRFAAQMAQEPMVVVLDPDVAAVFKTPEAVNRVLRALIATMPTVTE